MKTTVQIPDALYRRVKSKAAGEGQTFRTFLTQALREKLAQSGAAGEKPWLKMAGALAHLGGENRRIKQLIEDEFEVIEPEDRS